MPAGLDGNPEPIVTEARANVLTTVADSVEHLDGPRILVGIDGRSGAGKSTFADEVGRTLEQRGRVVVRSTMDLFHRPRAERMRRGPSSPEGYYLDSHQLPTIVDDLLVPFRSGAADVLVGAFDEPTDRSVPVRAEVPVEAVLLFDGLFVRRPELVDHWDLTVLLVADRRADEAWLGYLESGLPTAVTERAAELDRRLERARWPRYRHGWSGYLDAVADTPPTITIDNDDLATPLLVIEQPG